MLQISIALFARSRSTFYPQISAIKSNRRIDPARRLLDLCSFVVRAPARVKRSG